MCATNTHFTTSDTWTIRLQSWKRGTVGTTHMLGMALARTWRCENRSAHVGMVYIQSEVLIFIFPFLHSCSCADEASKEDCVQRALRSAFHKANTYLGTHGMEKVCSGGSRWCTYV